MKRNTDHIRMANDERGYRFLCRHCGEEKIVTVPIDFDEMLWKCKQFKKQHKKCLPKPLVETGHALSLLP